MSKKPSKPKCIDCTSNKSGDCNAQDVATQTSSSKYLLTAKEAAEMLGGIGAHDI